MTTAERTRSVTDTLTRHLTADGYRVWEQVPLERKGAFMRADVLALKPGFFWEHADVRIYEVKASRADFLGDVRRGKSLGYLDYAHRVFYVGEPEVVDPAVVPPEIDHAFSVVRPALWNPCEENAALLLYLMARWEE